VRINRYLAHSGLGARRAVEALVLEGKVEVDGVVVRDLAFRVAEGARVVVDGKPVRPRRKFRYFAYFKPRGVLTTRRDPEGRRTVHDVLPPALRDLKPVGRLDADTEGLLLLTDDGGFSQRVAHPSFQVVKKYLVEVDGAVGEAAVARLEGGVPLEDGHVGRVRVSGVAARPGFSRVTVTTTFGRKRMIRRMFGALDFKVKLLRRVAVGPVRLGELRPGQWRPLSAGEVATLLGQREAESTHRNRPRRPGRRG